MQQVTEAFQILSQIENSTVKEVVSFELFELYYNLL